MLNFQTENYRGKKNGFSELTVKIKILVFSDLTVGNIKGMQQMQQATFFFFFFGTRAICYLNKTKPIY